MFSFVGTPVTTLAPSTLPKRPRSLRRGTVPLPTTSQPSRRPITCVSTELPGSHSTPLSDPGKDTSLYHQQELDLEDDFDAAFLAPVLEDIDQESSTQPFTVAEDGESEEDPASSEKKSPLSEEGEWYSVDEPIAKPDTEGFKASEPQPDGEAAVDLLALDGASRDVLEKTSYESIVDVDIDDHGLLADDEDNSEFYSGVGLDALIDSEKILDNLRDDLDIETATHVQLSAIPRVQDGRDLVMQSHTGTGKTLAFLLPLLDEIVADDDFTQAAIVAPTRELAMQISRECDRLIAGTDIRNLPLIGGANPARQAEKLRRSAPHIVIGTPGRLSEMAEARELNARRLHRLVIDEADQCLKGEFGEQVMRLLRSVPKRVQKILVSATGDVDRVREFAGETLHQPVLLRVGGKLRVPRNLSHYVCIMPQRLRLETVRRILNSEPKPERTIIFVDEPRRVDLVAERLYRLKIGVGALRGSAHKTERKEVLDALRKGHIDVLVTTEVAARGLDVKEITHVINLDLPTDGDHYVHRAGRCGRAGRPGTVVNMAKPETGFVVQRLARELNVEITRMEPRGGKYCEPLQRAERKKQKEDAEDGNGAELRTRSGSNAREDARARRSDVRGRSETQQREEPKARKEMVRVKSEKQVPGLREGKARDTRKQEDGEMNEDEMKAEMRKQLALRAVTDDASFVSQLDELKQALANEETDTLSKKFGITLGEEEDDSGMESEWDGEPTLVEEEEEKPMKKNRVREIAKGSAKTKAKAKKGKVKRRTERPSGESSSSRAGAGKKRRAMTAEARASKEGWVGNRSA